MCSKECNQKDGAVKLLFLLPSFTFGGAERTSLNLLGGIDKSRFRVCLVTSRKIFPYFEHIEIERFLAVEDLGIETWFCSFKTFIRDIRSIALLLKKEQPDLAFGMMHYPSALLVFAKKIFLRSAKVIVSPRGPSSEYLRHFEKKFFRKGYLNRIFNFFCKYADGIVVPSRGMKEECVGQFSADPEKVTVISNCVDYDDIKRRCEEQVDLDIPPGFQLIATSGRLEREKNMPLVFKVFSQARRFRDLKLVVVGDGVEKENLIRLAQELGIDKDVIFTGFQRNPYKFIRRCDVFLHTCLFEGFANAIIEAMACGVPVVAVNCPYGPRDIIVQGESGFLVPMNDEKGMVDVLLQLTDNRELRERISEKAVERSKAFSVKNMVNGYEDFFCKVIKGAL